MNVPSKAFGEFVEHRYDTPRVSAQQLNEWVAQGQRLVILDSRPFEEYHRMNIPGGIGVRVDTAAYADCVIPPYYDSLLAKLITHGQDRDEAIARMRRALEMFVVEGIHTSISLHQRILAERDFLEGRFDTNFVNRFVPNTTREVGAKA